MFALATSSDEGVLHYWGGGEIWSVHPEESVRFVQEADADATIDIFKKAGMVSKRVFVVSLPAEIEKA